GFGAHGAPGALDVFHEVEIEVARGADVVERGRDGIGVEVEHCFAFGGKAIDVHILGIEPWMRSETHAKGRVEAKQRKLSLEGSEGFADVVAGQSWADAVDIAVFTRALVSAGAARHTDRGEQDERGRSP